MPTKRIICLAASRKHGGFCYAGKDIDTGEWVRPVSDDDGHAIPAYYRVISAGDPAIVGDVLSMSLGAHVPSDWQTENYEHVKKHWSRLGTVTYADAASLVDQPDSIWGAGRSSSHGMHDDMTEAEARGFTNSLLLIAVDDLIVSCSDEGYQGVAMKARAAFTYNGIAYRLRITDTAWFNCDEGDHEIGEALLCCSLAEAYDWGDGSRHVSKLVAAVITPELLG